MTDQACAGMTQVPPRSQLQQPQPQQPSARRIHDHWPPRTKAELERDDPSAKDGLSQEKLKLWRRQVNEVIHTAGNALKL